MIPDALREARRPLCLGIGGGGDVVGALATAEHCRIEYGARPVLGGVTWERRPIDPEPGPRAAAEIEGARAIGSGAAAGPRAPEAAAERRGAGADAGSAVLLASAHTRVRSSGVRFAESRMAELLAEETVLVDANHGPAAIAAGLGDAAAALGCDLVVFVDVGGDVLAHGDEPGLASPLCDSVLLAAAVRMAERASPKVLGGVFGIGCDGELTPDEVRARLDEVDRDGGLLGRIPIDERVARRLEEAVAVIPTEASALALRAFRGESGQVEIRGGRRNVDLRPIAAATDFFDPVVAAGSAARLAAAVRDARGLEAANEILHRLSVRTELDYEREAATAV
ncbi:MAG TPA: DUF1152 domain-containing protein [Thermoleophilaceae bacterium]|nr:DUF1152 domain-containing protein [Thermoleophilaceae bacterium]